MLGEARRLSFGSLALEDHSVIEEAELLAPSIYLEGVVRLLGGKLSSICSHEILDPVSGPQLIPL